MRHRAYGVVAGILVVLAAVMLGMIVNEADDPPTKILVPPPGDLPPEKPPTSVVDLGAIQPPSSVAGEGQASKPLGSPRQPAVTTTTSAKRTNPPPPATGRSGPAIVCPDVAGALPTVPTGARAEVNRELGNLENQIADANRRLVAAQGTSDPDFVRNTILGPLASQRVASLDRIAIAIGRFGPRPTGLERLAPCSVR